MKKSISILIILLGLALSFDSCSKSEDTPDPDPIVVYATLTGTIINSQTGEGLSNATIYFKKDLTATTYTGADYSVTTNSDGSYSIKVVSGTYKCFIVHSGFFDRVIPSVATGSGSVSLDAVTMVSEPTSGSYRFILVWGENPKDLDSHLTGPDGSGGRFHMNWSSYEPTSSVSLDVDDTDSYGPETTTISSLSNGMYRFSVHNFTNRYLATGGSGIASSPAVVEVYDHTGLKYTYTAPSFSGSGDTWRVFEMTVSGSTVSFNAINTYVLVESYFDNTIFKNGTKEATYNINDF